MLETLEAAEGCHDTLRQWVARQLEPLVVPRPGNRRVPVALAATGGNVESIARLALAYVDPLKIAVLSLRRLEAVIQMLSSMSVAERIRDLRLRPDRADVILPAALVYRYFAKLAQADRIVVPAVGLKEGVLLEVATGSVSVVGRAPGDRG